MLSISCCFLFSASFAASSCFAFGHSTCCDSTQFMIANDMLHHDFCSPSFVNDLVPGVAFISSVSFCCPAFLQLVVSADGVRHDRDKCLVVLCVVVGEQPMDLCLACRCGTRTRTQNACTDLFCERSCTTKAERACMANPPRASNAYLPN